MLKRTALILTALGALAIPATASAATPKSHVPRPHHVTHHVKRHHARIAGVEREYWPYFEEWLTPQEGREVEADTCAELAALATTGAAEAC